MNPIDSPEVIVSAMIDRDHSALVRYLDSGGDPELRYQDRSLIHWAVQESALESVRLLLKMAASTETQDEEGHFPLYQAAAEGSVETVQLLVEAGAVVNRVCDSGSALSIACAYEHLEVVRYLISAGADPDLPDVGGDTARSISKGYESEELLRTLNSGESGRNGD